MSSFTVGKGLTMVSIGRAIKIIRETKRLSLTQLAQLAELSVPFLSLIEGEAREPSLGAVEKVACALGVPAEAFLVLARPNVLQSTNTRSDGIVALVSDLADKAELLRRKLGELKDEDEGKESSPG